MADTGAISRDPPTPSEKTGPPVSETKSQNPIGKTDRTGLKAVATPVENHGQGSILKYYKPMTAVSLDNPTDKLESLGTACDSGGGWPIIHTTLSLDSNRRGADSGNPQPQLPETAKMDGVIASGNRGPHLTLSSDVVPRDYVGGLSAPSEPLMAQTGAEPNLDPQKCMRYTPPLTSTKSEIPSEISSTMLQTDGGGSESRSKPEQETAHSGSSPPNYTPDPGRSSPMVGSPTHLAPSGHDLESLMTPSPDQNPRIRIRKGGQMAPTGGPPTRVSAMLDRNTGQQHTGSSAPPQGTIGKQGGPHPIGLHRWVDQTTTLVEFISRLEDLHRGALSGWDYARRDLEEPLWSGPWPLKLAFQSLLGCLATDTLAIVAILGTEPPGNVILWEARKGTAIMAPRRFNEYRWYNLRQAEHPDHLMKELTGIILEGLVPSLEEFVPVDLDQTGGGGTPTDWTSSPLRGSFSRSNSPSPAGMLQEGGHDNGSEHSQPDGTTTDQTLWVTSSSPKRLLMNRKRKRSEEDWQPELPITINW